MYNKLIILFIVFLIYTFSKIENFYNNFNLSSHCEGISDKYNCCGAYGNQCKWGNEKCYNCSDYPNIISECSTECY